VTILQSPASLAEQIVEAVGYISARFPTTEASDSDDDFTLATNRIRSDTHVISILGDRGTGKSTLLVEVLQLLRADQKYIVLPPFSPELFGDTDTLLNIVLAAMHQQPWQFDQTVGDHERLELLRRLQAATRSSAMNAIPHRQLLRAASSINEVARELQDLAGGTEQLWQDVQRLFTSLISMHQSAIAAIVPVDDADMMKPSAQLDLVRQIRLLGGCRYVIPIVALKDGELSRQLKRETRAEFYPGLGLKADFDPSIEREVTDVVAQQLRKTFPQWAKFRMPQPSWRERVAYSPNDSERSLAALLRQTGTADEPPLAASPVLSNLLLASTGSAGKVTSNGVVPHPLPANLRKLDQLWSALYLLTARQSGHVAPDALARILSALQDTVDPPFGIEFPLEIDFEVIESAQEDSILAASVDYRGLYGIVQAGAWQDVTAGAGLRSQSDSSVYYNLRNVAKLKSKWRVSSSTVPDYYDTQGALSMALAIQGILLNSPNIRIEPGSRLTHGVSFDSIRFLQEVRLSGISTDDAFITFPQTSCFVSTARAIAAWAQIVERARRDQLSLVQLLALSIWASIAVFLDDADADVDRYPTDYHDAFLAASDRAESVMGMDTVGQFTGVSARHFLAWYQYWVPAHWHEALFDGDEIGDFIGRIIAVSGGDTGADVPDIVYVDRSLASRLKRYCSDAGTRESVEKYAWIGGYHQVVEGLDLDLPPTWGQLVVPAWRTSARASLVGGAVVAQSVSQPVGGRMDSTVGGDEQFAIEGNAELLVAYAIARLRSWARS
jgi:molybdopterin-guanine dinucleotide biosynthesis protein